MPQAAVIAHLAWNPLGAFPLRTLIRTSPVQSMQESSNGHMKPQQKSVIITPRMKPTSRMTKL